jgi:hypothetical protein
LQQQQNKTKHNTPAKTLNKQTKQEKKKPKTKIKKQASNKKRCRGAVTGMSVRHRRQSSSKTSHPELAVCARVGEGFFLPVLNLQYGDRLGFQTEP